MSAQNAAVAASYRHPSEREVMETAAKLDRMAKQGELLYWLAGSYWRVDGVRACRTGSDFLIPKVNGVDLVSGCRRDEVPRLFAWRAYTACSIPLALHVDFAAERGES